MLSRRLQILLDEDRYERLQSQAGVKGTSIAALVREAIDRSFPRVDPGRRAAGRRLLDADPMPVPDVGELKAELDAARGRS